jgi:glycosyltransferase involved in cell wall biosynthesis
MPRSARAQSRGKKNPQSGNSVESPQPSENHTVIFIEPFYGGSHKQLVDMLQEQIVQNSSIKTVLYHLPDKKWHWRLHCGSLYFAEKVAPLSPTRTHTLFCSSMFNLAEFLALRPEFCAVRKVIYFHENQLAYPSRQEDRIKREERDFHYGYAQIMSALAADVVVWNSDFNMHSFLTKIDSHLKYLPSSQKLGKGSLSDKILSKSKVLYFPLHLPEPVVPDESPPGTLLHVVWNHRWEHDKGPDAFFSVVEKLIDSGVRFKLSVVGESFGASPKVFETALSKIKESNVCTLRHWGYLSKDEYYRVLHDADIVVSTSNHEFFGVSVLEAVSRGCYPLVPNRLVYPEIYPATFLYNTDNQLYKQLRQFCKYSERFRREKDNLLREIDLQNYSWDNLKHKYVDCLIVKNKKGTRAAKLLIDCIFAIALLSALVYHFREL